MTPQDLLLQLQAGGHECRLRRDEVQIKTCHFCGNGAWNLELNAAKGIFHCWSCDAGGRLDRLLHSMLGGEHFIPVRRGESRSRGSAAPPSGVFAQQPAEQVWSARTYLHRRGFPDQDIRQYHLTVCLEPGHPLYGRIVVPVQDFWTGQLLGHVGRTYTGKLPKYLSTLPHRVVTGWRVRDWQAPCVLVEGFFDGMAVHRAGYHAAVLSGTSAGDVDQFVSLLATRHPSTPLVVMLDGSARDEGRRLQARISAIRQVGRVDLTPGADPGMLSPEVIRSVIQQTG